jgi:dihydroceramidase
MAVATILLTLPIVSIQQEEAQEQELSSSINFCEEDFQHSSYIAEPANVTSSLACYVPLALLGLFGPPSKYSTKHFAATYVTLLAIGVGSMLLHALLTAEAQGGDELPMLWYTASIAYCAMDVILHHVGTKSQGLGATVLASAVAVTATYIARREDFTIFYLMFSLYSQTIIVSILYIALKLDWEGTQGIEFKINVLFPLALSAGWFTILAIWTWVSEMLFCHAVTKDHIWGKVIAPLIWNRVVHPLWHFFSGMLAWLLIQLLLSAHGMQQQWGIPTLQWFGAPYVAFEPHSKDPSAACSIR